MSRRHTLDDRRQLRRLGGLGGFTLAELLVATAIMGIVISAVMQSFMWQNRAYTVVDEVTESQQNMRAISYLMERDVRVTGFMVSESAAVCGVDGNANADVLFLTDADSLDPTNQVGELGAEESLGFTGTMGTDVVTVDNVVLDGTPFYDTNGDAVPDSDFQVNGGAIVINDDDPTAGTACGTVTAVNLGAQSVTIDFLTAMGPPPPGDRIRVIPAHVYQIDAQQILRRDGLQLAADVEDLQAAFFFDVDGDGQMTIPANESPGSAAGPQYFPQNWDHRTLREVRLNVVVRTRNQDAEARSNLFQATENRVPIALSDGFRRRVHTTTVRTRNVGFRGLAG